jgi:cytochrome oxidase Cu insertion factor (SCO1/SenC/PrrC family)
MPRREAGALAVFLGLTVITVGWWVLAFWPTGAPTSELLERTRDVCFGTSATGLPEGAGWLALVLQPTILFGLYFIIMGQAFEDGVRAVVGRRTGRVLVGGYVVLLFAGLSGVGARVANASDLLSAGSTSVAAGALDAYPQIGRVAPEFVLVDQFGEALSLERFRGRPVMVTFAFGHCETVCPAVVHDVKAARRRVPESNAAVVVISLDPWRDLPSRLAHMADQWELGDDSYAVSGPVSDVEAALDAWQVPRARDTNTGDIVHPRLVYLVDGEGVIVYAVTGGVDQMVGLLGRM